MDRIAQGGKFKIFAYPCSDDEWLSIEGRVDIYDTATGTLKSSSHEIFSLTGDTVGTQYSTEFLVNPADGEEYRNVQISSMMDEMILFIYVLEEDTPTDSTTGSWELIDTVSGCGSSLSNTGVTALSVGGRFKIVARPCESDGCLSLSLRCTMTNTDSGSVTSNHEVFSCSVDDGDSTKEYTYEFEIDPPEGVTYSNFSIGGMYDGFDLYIYKLI